MGAIDRDSDRDMDMGRQKHTNVWARTLEEAGNMNEIVYTLHSVRFLGWPGMRGNGRRNSAHGVYGWGGGVKDGWDREHLDG